MSRLASFVDGMLIEPSAFHVWIAWRTDGIKGSGMQSNPYNGSSKLETIKNLTSLAFTSGDAREVVATTAGDHGYGNGNLVQLSGDTGNAPSIHNGVFAIYGVTGNTFKIQIAVNAPAPSGTHTVARVSRLLFDDVMAGLPADTQVHLGPTTAGKPFLTKGYADEVAGGWQLKSGQKITGSGIVATTLQLVGAATADKQYYAMGHALKITSPASANPLDAVEISDLTIDCALHAQPVTVGKYAPVACGAIRLMGSHCRIARVKAINWGTKSSTLDGRVFDLVVAVADPYLVETVNSGFVDCFATEPCQNSLRSSTAFSIRGIEHGSVCGYGKSPFIRSCFVDGKFRELDSSGVAQDLSHALLKASSTNLGSGSFTGAHAHQRKVGEYVAFQNPVSPSSVWNGFFPVTHVTSATTLRVDLSGSLFGGPDETVVVSGAELRGAAISSCRGGVVERSQFHHVWFGLYVEGVNAKDVIVRNNVFMNVASGAYWKAGEPGSVSSSVAVTNPATNILRVATTFAHNLYVKAWIKLASDDVNGVFQVSKVIDAYTFEFAHGTAPSGTKTYQLVPGVDKLLFEHNAVELAAFDSLEFGAPRLDAANSWQPIAVLLSDAGSPAPSFPFGNVVVRKNRFRYLDTDNDDLIGTAMQMAGVQNLLLQNNMVETIPPDRSTIYTENCGHVTQFDDRSTAGPPVDEDTDRFPPQLDAPAADALALACFDK